METAEEKLHYFIEYNGGIIPSAPWEFRRIMFTTKLSYEEVRLFYAQKMDEFFPLGDNNNENSEEMGKNFENSENYKLEDYESEIDSLPDLDANLDLNVSNLDQDSENSAVQDLDSVYPELNKNKTKSNSNNDLLPMKKDKKGGKNSKNLSKRVKIEPGSEPKLPEPLVQSLNQWIPDDQNKNIYDFVKQKRKQTFDVFVNYDSEDEPKYCLCNRPEFGYMIACDNNKCVIEWFHFECVNLNSEPKGKWYCPTCLKNFSEFQWNEPSSSPVQPQLQSSKTQLESQDLIRINASNIKQEIQQEVDDDVDENAIPDMEEFD